MDEKTKFFSVEKEIMYVKDIDRFPVYSDGEKSGDNYNVDVDGYPETITIGFLVNIYGEDGFLKRCEFYPVNTNMLDFTNNEKEVLDKIKADFPAGEWQNNEW